ncbi:hypothetical protein BT69DRAFT_223607 [Atractiella rhizophila]|nr:hypothetical protein BT69DRAFT_223607 [Atractiella rhizophila]
MLFVLLLACSHFFFYVRGTVVRFIGGCRQYLFVNKQSWSWRRWGMSFFHSSASCYEMLLEAAALEVVI